MSSRFQTLAVLLTIGALFGSVSAAQQPRITNGRLAPVSVAGSLQQAFRSVVSAQTDAAWIAYSVPSNDRNRVMCCWTNASGTSSISGSMTWSDAPCCGACRIEPSEGKAAPQAAPASGVAPGPIKLEGPERVLVFFRIVDRQVERIRTYSETCELDAGDRTVHWLEGVRPADSIALLESLAGSDPSNRARKSRLSNAALGAIAAHGDPAAATTLERLARGHAVAATRGDAIFWLAQLAGSKVASAITAAIENDPDTDVKKRAVFALSQLPKDEGVPLLIDVAKRNPNPVVKKQAIFWLGQSKDPRAIDFFAQILK